MKGNLLNIGLWLYETPTIFDVVKSWISKWQPGQFSVETVRGPFVLLMSDHQLLFCSVNMFFFYENVEKIYGRRGLKRVDMVIVVLFFAFKLVHVE